MSDKEIMDFYGIPDTMVKPMAVSFHIDDIDKAIEFAKKNPECEITIWKFESWPLEKDGKFSGSIQVTGI